MSKPRVDRLLTMCLFHPVQRLVTSTGNGQVPILMYHSISDNTEEGVPAYYRTTTHPKVFAEHMALLKAEGWQVTGLKHGRELMRRGGDTIRKLAIVTFDDGFRDFHTHAFPVLQHNGFSATMFLPTAFIGAERRSFKERECLTWNEVRECLRGGMEFGSHTVNHPKLYELSFAQIRAELEVSRSMMEHELGERIATFAYPYAFPSADRAFVAEFTGLLKDTGYDCNVTTRIGRVTGADDPFTLKRLPANSADDAALFQAKLEGAYDWMNWPQDTLKKFKRSVVSRRGKANPRPCQAR